MDNPFAGLKIKQQTEQRMIYGDEPGLGLLEEHRKQMREEIYTIYTPLVYEILDQLIAAYAPGIWVKDSDCLHAYCCRINWFAGPVETYKANYDEHHTIRRRIEISLEQDRSCTPTGFRITLHGKVNRVVHVGLTREDLVQGIREVFE